MNAFCNGNDIQIMVTERMKDIQSETDQNRLVHEASLSKPGIFGRMAVAIGNGLIKLGQRLHENYTNPRQAYQATSSKYAL